MSKETKETKEIGINLEFYSSKFHKLNKEANDKIAEIKKPVANLKVDLDKYTLSLKAYAKAKSIYEKERVAYEKSEKSFGGMCKFFKTSSVKLSLYNFDKTKEHIKSSESFTEARFQLGVAKQNLNEKGEILKLWKTQ